MSLNDKELAEQIIKEADELRSNGHYEKSINRYSDAIVLLSANNKRGELSATLGGAYAGLAKCYKSLNDEEKYKEHMATAHEKMGDSFGYMLSIPVRKTFEEAYDLRQKQEHHYDQAKKYRGEGCFITSAVCYYSGKPDNCIELTTLRNYRDCWLKNQADGKKLIDEYYKIAPKIVRNIKKLSNCKEIFSSLLNNYIEPCIELINSEKFVECKNLYIKMVNYAKTISK